MANWKKVIVSGSDAELRKITGSGLRLNNLPGNTITVPLVIDSDGNVNTGSEYALASGGDTVGGRSLESNVAIIGAGGSLIQTSSISELVNFNSASLENAVKIISNTGVFKSIRMSSSLNTDAGLVFDISSSGELNISKNTVFKGTTNKFSGSVTMSVVPLATETLEVLVVSSSGELMKAQSSDIGGVNSVAGGNNISVDTTTGAVTVNLDSDLSNIGSITASKGLHFSSSLIADKEHYRIDYAKVLKVDGFPEPTSGSLTITASGIKVEGNLDADGDITLDGTLSFNGVNFSEQSISRFSGSTSFGTVASGSDTEDASHIFPSDITHVFTGSMIVTGGLEVMSSISSSLITATTFSGDGSQLTGLNANNISLQSLTFGEGLTGGDSSYAGNAAKDIKIKLHGPTLVTSSNGIKVNELGIDTAQIALNAIIPSRVTSSFIIDQDEEFTNHHRIDSSSVATGKFILMHDDGLSPSGIGGVQPSGMEKMDLNVLRQYISSSFEHDGLFTQEVTPITYDFKLGSVSNNASILVLSASSGDNDTVTFEGTDNEIDITVTNTDPEEGTIKIGLPNDVTIGNHLIVGGDLTVNGTTTTFNTQDLSVEDRFILLGSGSANLDNNLDIGIIFESGSQNGNGTALFYDADQQRLSVGKNVSNVDFTSSIAEVEGEGGETTNTFNIGQKGIFGGNVVTVKTNQSTAPKDGLIGAGGSASFGEGEMYIHNGDIYIYID